MVQKDGNLYFEPPALFLIKLLLYKVKEESDAKMLYANHLNYVLYNAKEIVYIERIYHI